MQIKELVSLIKRIQDHEWKWHPSQEVICCIHESNASYYYQILLKKTSNAQTVSAIYDLRLGKKEYRIENKAFSATSSLLTTLERSKEGLIYFVEQLNCLPEEK